MSGITSDTGLCNLALGHLGNYGTVSNISTPTNDKERTFALWYDITRQTLLQTVMPNFALARRLIADLVITTPFGYTYAFEYPTDCLKVLGIGEPSDKALYPFAVEERPGGTGRVILTDDAWADGLPLRFIKDVTNVNAMSADFKLLLSLELAFNVCLPITQSADKKALILKMLPGEKSQSSAINAQENRPVRISNSRFRAARAYDVNRNETKR